jgi:uncharacterized membrane protein YciS (DUF1049 family)
MIIFSFVCGMLAGWLLCDAMQKVRKTRMEAAELLKKLKERGFLE